MLRSIEGESLVSIGTGPHWHPLRRMWSCVVLGDHLPVVIQPLSHVRLSWPHGLQRARLPCPSPTPGVCSNACPLRRWCLPTISASVTPSPALSLSQHQGLFQWASPSYHVAKVLELHPAHSAWSPFTPHSYHGCTCLFLCQYHIVSTTVAL